MLCLSPPKEPGALRGRNFADVSLNPLNMEGILLGRGGTGACF